MHCTRDCETNRPSTGCCREQQAGLSLFSLVKSQISTVNLTLQERLTLK